MMAFQEANDAGGVLGRNLSVAHSASVSKEVTRRMDYVIDFYDGVSFETLLSKWHVNHPSFLMVKIYQTTAEYVFFYSKNTLF